MYEYGDVNLNVLEQFHWHRPSQFEFSILYTLPLHQQMLFHHCKKITF